MLKVLLRLVLLLLVFAGIVAAIGSFLPRDFDIQMTRTLKASPDELFPALSDLSRWPEWSAWESKDKSFLKVELGPITSGVGASQTWTDPRGEGKLWITESVANELVVYQVRFGNWPEITNRITLNSAESGTEIQWSSAGQLPSGPFYGYFRGFFCEGMRREYNFNLERLEKLIHGVNEKPQQPVAAASPVEQGEKK